MHKCFPGTRCQLLNEGEKAQHSFTPIEEDHRGGEWTWQREGGDISRFVRA